MAQIIKTPEDRIGAQLMDYLSKKTNQAILLTGSWGSGKTHYIKNYFFPNVRTETSYKPFIISLFGVTSVDDIKEKLMAELYPLLENKYIQSGTPLFKAIFKAVDVTRLAGAGIFEATMEVADKVVKVKKEKLKEALNINNMVICFDDLERANQGMLSENQLLGYINGLTEDEVKVIIIANEQKLDDEIYKQVKEKTIGTTIHFQQSFAKSFDDILDESQFEASYLTFLRGNENLIHDFLSKENKQHINYRTLKYFVVYFYEIAHFVQAGFKILELDKIKADILQDLLRFSLCICIEFKRGRIDFKQKQALDNSVSYAIRKMYDNAPHTPKNIGEEIMHDYFPNDDFYFYQSIYSYLTGGDIFDKQALLNELKQKFHVVDENISESYKTYNRLASASYFELPDREIKSEVKKMLGFAHAGQYLARDYSSIFYFILRDGNILNIKPESLCESFEATLRKIAKHQPYDPILERYLSSSGEGAFEEFHKRLRQLALKINENAAINSTRQMDKSLQKDLKENYEKLHSFLLIEINKPYSRATLSGINPLVFFRVFKSAENLQKQQMVALYFILYNNHRGNNEKADYDFACALSGYITKHISIHLPKNASGNLLLQLKDQVETHIKNLRSTFGISTRV